MQSTQFLILDLDLTIHVHCYSNVAYTDVHIVVLKVITAPLPSLCIRLVVSLRSGRAGGGAVSSPKQVGGIGSCPITVSGLAGHQPQTLRKWLDTVGYTTWGDVILALRVVGEDDVANKLKVKYGELATTVVSLTLLARNVFGWEECYNTQLHLALLHTSQLKTCASIPEHNSYYLASTAHADSVSSVAACKQG